ncbi:MAG TPA: tetratricopeptide repeat protein [Phaeodactylibacter sp.]|nr:tetratricopeptide repeat protein [Phaeodactylibacter sp.]
MINKIFTILFFLSFLQLSFGKGNVDSLLVALQNAKEDTTIVNHLEKLSWEYHRTQPEKTIFFAQKSLEIAHKLDYTVGIIRAKNVLAVAYSIQGNFDKAFLTFNEAILLAEATDNQFYICRTYNNIGRTYMKIGDFENAINFYQKGDLCSKHFNLQQQMSDNLLNMASAMQEQKMWDAALQYAQEALKIADNIHNENLLCDAHKIIGISLLQQHQLDEAATHLKTALFHAKNKGDKVGTSSIMNQLGMVYFQKKQPDLALEAHRKAYQDANQIDYKEQKILALQHLAELYLLENQESKAIEKSMEGVLIAEQLGNLKHITIFYDLLSKIYAAKNDFPQAYIFHTKLKTLSDSLTVAEKNQKLSELKIQFQLESKEAENQLLKAQQAQDKLTIQKATLASSAIIIALLGVCFITFLLFKSFKEKQAHSYQLEGEVKRRTHELEKINADLKKSNKEMERFNHIASHDLKEPLRNIISFTRLLELRLKNKEDRIAHEYLSFVITNAKQMNTLIEDVLEFSKVSNKKIELEEVDLSKIMEQVLTSLQPILEKKTTDIFYKKLPTIESNSTQLYILLKNIIENGIKYNNHITPSINISYKRIKDKHHICITDNGIGIDPAYHHQIFDMFKRLHNRQEAEGSGLGLSICQKIAHRLGGEILVKSAVGKGSTFTLVLPTPSAAPKTAAPKKLLVFK